MGGRGFQWKLGSLFDHGGEPFLLARLYRWRAGSGDGLKRWAASSSVPFGETRAWLTSVFCGSLRKRGHGLADGCSQTILSGVIVVNCPYRLLQVSWAGAERVHGWSWGLGRCLTFHLTGWGSFLSELDGRFSGKSLPWGRAIVSVPEQLLFEKMIKSNWDLHYYSRASRSANICWVTKHWWHSSWDTELYIAGEWATVWSCVWKRQRSGSPISYGRNSNKGTVMEG